MNNNIKQEEYKGIITKTEDNNNGGQSITAQITDNNGDKKEVNIETGTTISEQVIKYQTGDKVFVLSMLNPEDNTESFYITDFNRQGSLISLFVLFSFVVILISKKWGINSILGMFYSFFIIFNVILPLLLKGYNPLVIGIIGALLISPVTFYLSHGISRKTTIALASTMVSLFITGILSLIFIGAAKLSGFGSDEAFFLQVAKEGTVNIKGLFLAGIIIGTLGILDDVTISQSAIVSQLKNNTRGLTDWELYKKAMDIGHDHIASTVNTLVLVYAGAALPLLLLFTNSQTTFGQAINSEIIAEEIVRTLVGSIGLVLAVPISTIFAVLFSKK